MTHCEPQESVSKAVSEELSKPWDYHSIAMISEPGEGEGEAQNILGSRKQCKVISLQRIIIIPTPLVDMLSASDQVYSP